MPPWLVINQQGMFFMEWFLARVLVNEVGATGPSYIWPRQ